MQIIWIRDGKPIPPNECPLSPERKNAAQNLMKKYALELFKQKGA